MISEVIVSRLDELIGQYDTPFFNYLLYSYDLSLNDCEEIIEELKSDINSSKIIPDNLVSAVDDYFKSKVMDLENREKIEYLDGLIRPDSEFFIKYLKRYDLGEDEIELIKDRVRTRILEDNISDFEIKRYLEYYFDNSVKQTSYLFELNTIRGKNYDTLIIRKAKRQYPILTDRDISDVISDIQGDIIDAYDFKMSIRDDFLRRCMIKSEDKKAMCRKNLELYVFGKGDAFAKLVKSKNLEKRDGEIIVSKIQEDIYSGLIQPERVDGYLLTKYFNDYNEGQ